MGNIMRPGFGDLLDRYGILQRKIRQGDEKRHFTHEAAEIHGELETRTQARWTVELLTRAVRLTEVNCALWEAEDKIGSEFVSETADPSSSARVIVHLARLIHRLNRERALLVHEINEFEAGQTLPKEKV